MTFKTTLSGFVAVGVSAMSAFAADAVRYDVDGNRERTLVAYREDRDWCQYNANEWNFELFGTGTVGEKTLRRPAVNRIERDGKLGAGAGVQYFFHRNIGIAAEAYSESTADNFVDNVDLNLIGRFPIGTSGVAPYLIAGAGRQIDPIYQWTFGGGAGVEWRFARHVGVFLDGRYVIADETKDYGLGRLGVKFGF